MKVSINQKIKRSMSLKITKVVLRFFIAIAYLFTAPAFAQLVLNNGGVVKLNGGTSGTPIYFVLNTPPATPIKTIITAGTPTNGIVLEAEYNILQYNLDRHIEIQKRYFNNIKNLLFNYSDDCIYGSIPVIFKKEINKDYFINKNIEVYKYYNPIKNKKNSKYIFSRIINFPINDQLSNNSVDYISEKILEII